MTAESIIDFAGSLRGLVAKCRVVPRSGIVGIFCLTVLALSPFRYLLADSYVPPAGVPFKVISVSSSSNSVNETLASGYGYWFKTTINRGKPCTIWTSNITNGTITGITAYEIGTSKTGTATASTHFTSSTDRDGNLRLKLLSTAWSSSDDNSYNFYFNVTGSANTRFTLNYQLAEVDEVLIGSTGRPYEFDFKTSTAPKSQYGTVTNAVLDAGPDAGSFYAASKLVAGKRYYFGVATNTAAAVALSVIDPDGNEVDLSPLRRYGPWITQVYTNLQHETVVSNVGICRDEDAWKFVPTKTGRYLFRFEGQAGTLFTMYDAVMPANSYEGELVFSEDDGTYIPDGSYLKVKVSHTPAQGSTNIFYTIDGSDPRCDGIVYVAGLKITSSTTFKAVALLDDGDYGDVYSANYYLQRGAIADGLGVTGMDATLSDSATNWYVDVETTSEGTSAIRHVAIGDDEQVDLSMVLRGRGVFSFRWRVSSEEGWDKGVFYTNGVEVASISGETAWADGLVSIPLVGTSELTWTYSKDKEDCAGADCLWLADFAFEETVTLSSGEESVEVERRWLDDHGLSDVATALTQLELSKIDKLPDGVASKIGALPRSLYESYLCGLNPTNAADVFRATIEMVGGVPVIDWSPNLGEERRYEIMGAASLGAGQWHSPTNSSDRLFKVKVSMPREVE